MKIILEKELEEFWATEEELKSMTDKEVIDMLLEDLSAVIDNATWKIQR